MEFLKRLFRTYRDKAGVVKIRTPEVEILSSAVYFEYKAFSDLYEYASFKNFGDEIKEASHGLACVIAYRNLYQEQINEIGEDELLIANILIVCRFATSIYATMRLANMGLILDAMGCLKTAFEALQYGRLIHLNPEFASSYMSEKSLRPVEVRKELQKLGHDVDLAIQKYKSISTFSHVGGTGETLALEPSAENVHFKIGGYVDSDLQKKIIEDCHTATGEFIAFGAGIRHENVGGYHSRIKQWIADGVPVDEMMDRISNLIDVMKQESSSSQNARAAKVKQPSSANRRKSSSRSRSGTVEIIRAPRSRS